MQQPILLQEQVYHNFFDQLQVICGHVSNAVNVMINKAVTGTKFTRRDLKKNPDWHLWLHAEWKHLTHINNKVCLMIHATSLNANV